MSHPHTGSHGREHEHGRGRGLLARLRHLLRPHSHDAADQIDAVMEASAEGMRTLWITFAILGLTALTQAVVTVLSGLVALLGDTLRNAADALTALPWESLSYLAAARRPAATPTGTVGQKTWLASPSS